jgi:hypothetical protein
MKIRIAKPGYNVLTETDLDNIIFDSAYDTLKYHLSGTKSLVVAGSDAETTVTHGLGYIPFFIVFVQNPSVTTRYSMTPYVFEDVADYAYLSAYADSDKIYFTAHTNTLNATVNYYYKVFRNNTGL